MDLWVLNHEYGQSLWKYTYIDEDGHILYEFLSYIKKSIGELEQIYPNHDDILMEIVTV